MKKNYLRVGLVVGTKGIGQAHIREFLNFNLEKVGLYGKKFDGNRVNKLKFDKKKSQKIYNLKNFNEIRKFKPKVISICTPTELHSRHIYLFSKISKNLLVEKPLNWKDNLDNYLIAKKIFKLRNNLIVNLPMINLASQIHSREKIKKIAKINFNYYTNGKQTYRNIPVDLLPHALSFCITILKKNEISYRIINVRQEKTSWSCEIYLNNCKCKFKLRQNKNQKISKLSFKLNNNVYLRKQIKSDNNYRNLIIKNSKKIIKIKNPMSEYITKSLKNFHNKKYLNSNNQLTLLITKITQDLINYKTK